MSTGDPLGHTDRWKERWWDKKLLVRELWRGWEGKERRVKTPRKLSWKRKIRIAPRESLKCQKRAPAWKEKMEATRSKLMRHSSGHSITRPIILLLIHTWYIHLVTNLFNPPFQVQKMIFFWNHLFIWTISNFIYSINSNQSFHFMN